MKKIVLLLISIICITCINNQNQNEKEKEAVLKVLKEETDAFIANDLERIAAIHIQDSTLTRMSIGSKDYNFVKGWDEVKKMFENYFKVNSTDSSWQNPRNNKDNIIMKVADNSAWLVCDNTWKYEYNNEEMGFTNMQVAFFEKVNGKWKFSFDSYIQKPVVNDNKKVARKYHELKAEDVNSILCDDFIGRNEKSRHTWNAEQHIKYLSNGVYKKDSIFHQTAEGNWVTTRFVRTMDWNGKRVSAEMMHFKKFRNGKIAEIWEYGDTRQVY